MTVRISELAELSADLSQSDVLPIVDLSAGETKQVSVESLLTYGISGAPSYFIDLSKLNPNSATKLSASFLDNTGVASGTYGNASTVAQFVVNSQGLITTATGVPILIAASGVTGLAAVATSGTYASLAGLPTLGTLASQDAGSIVVSGGTLSGVTFISENVIISGGTISGISDLAIADGGTGASTASDARTNLGLAIGANVQAYSAVLSSVASQFDEADKIVYASASGVISATSFTSLARSIVSGSTASQVRSTIGIGTISTQDANSIAISGGTISNVTLGANNVTISGGTIVAITDLAIADGGTGASTASDARTNLGLAIGADVQAYSSSLANITTAASGTDLFFYTTASGAVASAQFSSAARDVVASPTISGMRGALGLGSVALLNALSIGSGDISNDAVTTDAILDGSIVSSKIAANAVSYSKLAQTSQSNVLLGRATASGGNVEEIPCTAAARSILDDASIADIRATLGLGTLALANGDFSGTSTGTNTGDQTITLTGDITGTGTGTFAATISNSAIVEDKVASNAITTVKVASGAITAVKLADQSASVVAASSPSASGAFIGQQWINTNNALEYTWTGTEWLQQSALNTVVASGDSVYSFATAYPDEYSAVITASLNTQGANNVFAGPASGSDTAPSFRALIGNDLPNATSSTKGAVIAGAGLAMNGSTLDHSNTIASGIYYKVQVDGQGHVSSGAASLAVEDIPSLDASKITTGTFGNAFIGDDAVLAPNLGNYSTTQFGETLPVADFIGQYFFNPLSKDLYLWDGNVWNPVGISVGEIVFAGTYNASGNTIASVTGEGTAIGLSVGQPLPAASITFNKYYVVVASGGTGTSPAPTDVLQPPDIILCNGSSWVHIDVSSTYVAQTASQVSFTPGGTISSANVQAAIEEVNNECRNLNNVASGVLSPGYGGTGFASYTKGDLLAASGTAGFAKLTVGTNGRVLTANSATTTGLEWLVPASGTVLSVNATAPLSVASGTTTPHITISGATTSAAGVVQLSDSISTTSSVLAATATAVKSAYDLANAALPKAGGTLTGNLELGTNVTIIFEGTTSDAFETTLTVANPTADNTITLPNISGTVITNGDTGTVTSTMLLDGTILNADVNASAAIAGTKIAPNFGSQAVTTTGTSTAASFIPTSSTVPTNGLYLPSAGSVAISTNGTGKLFVDASGNVGLGATSPVARLHVRDVVASGEMPVFLSNNSATAGASVALYLSPSGGALTAGSIRAAAIKGICDSANVTNLAFFTNSSGADPQERARIDSSGRLLVGTGSNSQVSSIVAQGNSSGSTGAGVLYLNLGATNPSAGANLGIIRFADSGSSTAAEIAAIRDGGTWTSGTSQPSALKFSTTPDGPGGSPTERARITSDGYLRLAATNSLGIQFNGDTAAANALDDYEEGTWPVQLYDALTAGNLSATTATGYYTKVGRMVHATFTVSNISTVGLTAGNILHYTLPFTSVATIGYRGTADTDTVTFLAGRNYASATIGASVARGYMLAAGTGVTNANVLVSQISTGVSDISVSISYYAA